VSEAELATERDVVLGEIADYDDSPDDVVHDAALRLLWRTHPLGRPVHGSARSVAALSRQTLLDYRDRWYTPGALILTAAGDVSHERLVGLLKGTSLADSRPAPRTRPRSPKSSRGSRILPRETEQAHLCLAVPAAGWCDEQRFADALLAAALGIAPSSRLFHQIRERRGLAYSVGAFHMPCATVGVLTLYANTMPDKAGRVEQLLTREVQKLCRSGVSERELERVRNGVIANLLMNMDSPVSEARRLGYGALHRGMVNGPEHVIRKLQAVTAADLQNRAVELFGEGFWVRAVVGPEDEPN
jgi:predicted Zn-dependent peptidase